MRELTEDDPWGALILHIVEWVVVGSIFSTLA